jgi:ElaB/YqjD/DUF883 family membrane-anchored ribosome-binding protein
MNDTNRTLKKAGDLGSEIVDNAIDAARDKFADLADDVEGRGEKFIKTARAKGMQAWDEIQERGEGAVKDLNTWVKRNPLPAVGIAIAAGAVLYALFTRDSD